MSNEQKLVAMLRRFLNEGEYNDEGDYVFASDTQETGPLAEPGSMVPGIVLDAVSLLREDNDMAEWAKQLEKALRISREYVRRRANDMGQPPDEHEQAVHDLDIIDRLLLGEDYSDE